MTAAERDHIEHLLVTIRRRLARDIPGRTLREAQTHEDVVEALAIVRERGSPP